MLSPCMAMAANQLSFPPVPKSMLHTWHSRPYIRSSDVHKTKSPCGNAVHPFHPFHFTATLPCTIYSY